MELFRTPISYYWENAVQTKYAIGMMPELVLRNIDWLGNGDINYLVKQTDNVDNLEGRVLAEILGIIGRHCPSQRNKIFTALRELEKHEAASVKLAAQTAMRRV